MWEESAYLPARYVTTADIFVAILSCEASFLSAANEGQSTHDREHTKPKLSSLLWTELRGHGQHK